MKLCQKHDPLNPVAGYWLEYPRRSGEYYWLGADKYAAAKALEKACSKLMPEKNGPREAYEYGAQYCHGRDVFGNESWANLDCADMLLDLSESLECFWS